MSQIDNNNELINRGVSLTIRIPKFNFFIFYLFASPEFQLSIFLILVLVMVICRH